MRWEGARVGCWLTLVVCRDAASDREAEQVGCLFLSDGVGILIFGGYLGEFQEKFVVSG